MKLTFSFKPSSRLAQLTTLAVAVGVLQGCTSLSDNNSVVEVEPVTTEQQLAEHLAEWETYKPKIDGLLEKDAAEEEAALAAATEAETPTTDVVRSTKIPPLMDGDTPTPEMAMAEDGSMPPPEGMAEGDVPPPPPGKKPMEGAEMADTANDPADVQKIPSDKANTLPKRAEKYVVAEMSGTSKIDEKDAKNTSLDYSLPEESLLDADKAVVASSKAMGTEDTSTPNDNYVRAEFQSEKKKSVASVSKTTKKSNVTEYGLQLSSHTVDGDAEKNWAKVSRKFRTLLAGKEAVIEEATVKGKLHYRLKVGPYYNKAIATDVCKQLVLSHQDCILSDYYGEPLM